MVGIGYGTYSTFSVLKKLSATEHAPFIEQNKLNIEANPKLYKQRQAIVEHPYGILKRQWGFYYIITKKGEKRASADVGLMFTAFNLRRLMNIVDKNVFKKFLKELGFLFFSKRTSINKNKAVRLTPIFQNPTITLFLHAA